MTTKIDTAIPIIDIFAGPGGLAEGFSAANEAINFSVKLSIEKDEIAHKTLELRSFLRSFGYGSFPSEYYEYIKGSGPTRKELFDRYPDNAKRAKNEAWQVELGSKSSEAVHTRIKQALDGSKYWVLLGGPPCQAYSLVGRARMTGLGTGGRSLAGKEQKALREEKLDAFNNDHRHSLYKEYLKIVAVHKPTIFVMENVKGILSSKHGEDFIFEKILADLRDPWAAIAGDEDLKDDATLRDFRPRKMPKYKLFSFVTGTEPGKDGKLDSRGFIIRSENHGIPQRRHRVIILGILDEYEVRPKALKREGEQVTVKDAISSLPKMRSGLSKAEDTSGFWESAIVRGFPASVLERMDKEILPVIKQALKALGNAGSRGGQYVAGVKAEGKSEFDKWISDPMLKGAIQHETRGHMDKDLWRYLYAASYGQAKGYSPTIEDFPDRFLPNHKNVRKNGEKDAGEEIHFKDRFKVQVANEPATTITSHISKDGHYYIHYDPAQCRSLTVREAARLQTFPDNYFFEGNRTQQYHQVGNAVPPLLARKLAHVVSDALTQCLRADRLPDADKASKRQEKRRA